MKESSIVTDIVLWHMPRTRSTRALLVLNEIGVDYKLKTLDISSPVPTAFTDEYLAMNRNHTVPLLQCKVKGKEVTMFESAAIVAFLADAFPNAGLVPPVDDLERRAEYYKWLHYGSTMMDAILWQLRLNKGPMALLPSARRDAQVVDEYEEKWRVEVEPTLVEAFNDGRQYICGNEFTAADCVLGQTLFWSTVYGLSKSNATLKDYLDRFQRRPAWAKTAADFNDFPSLEVHQRFAEKYTVTRAMVGNNTMTQSKM